MEEHQQESQPVYPRDDPVALLQELIRRPSVNPMGRSDWSAAETTEILLEQRMTDYLCGWLTTHGFAYIVQHVSPQRNNVIAWLEGDPQWPTVLLDAHQDTVPVEGMTVDPFAAEFRDGRIYGRGACDIKGAMACILTACSRLKSIERRPPVVISCTCDEELGQTGARQLTECWSPPQSRPDDLSALEVPDQLPARPDLAIVAEPTSLEVVVAHRGTARWRVEVGGRAAHSSQPDQGINAIYRMARLVSVLEEYAATLATRVTPHPLCGVATLSVGRVAGGTSVNIVPDRCAIDIDRRVLPGEDVPQLLEDVRQFIAERVDFEFDMQPPTTMGMSLDNSNNMTLAAQLGNSISAVAGHSRSVGVAYTTHAPRFAKTGMPTVVFGPGSIEQAHTKDEWIEVAQLHLATDILVHFLTEVVAASR